MFSVNNKCKQISYQCSFTNVFYTASDDCQNVLENLNLDLSSVDTFMFSELFPHLNQCSGEVQLFVFTMVSSPSRGMLYGNDAFFLPEVKSRVKSLLNNNVQTSTSGVYTHMYIYTDQISS